MRKLVALLLVVVFTFSLTGCSTVKKGADNYQYMYDVVKDWNARMEADAQRENLFGFGEYLYNSHLILFPREKPVTLDEFYFEWNPAWTVDGYAAYFTCKLKEENFDAFVEELANFTVKTQEKETKLLFNDTNFAYDAYIIQWVKPDEEWEVLEYILLDEENGTVIFVYTMGMLEQIDANVSYDIKPKDKHSEDITGFTIYDDFENAEYDIDFLEILDKYQI